ncbi:hypothetical protein EV183_003747, partial [Coemansia sp. RSA 2336]
MDFDTLPELIKANILEHIGFHYADYQPLLYLTRDWHYQTARMLGTSYGIEYDCQHNSFYGIPFTPFKQDTMTAKLLPSLVKTVNLTIMHNDIACTDIETAQNFMENACAYFPAATKLHISIVSRGDDTVVGSNMANAQAAIVFKHLHKLVPNVKSISLHIEPEVCIRRMFYVTFVSWIADEFGAEAQLNALACNSLYLPELPSAAILSGITRLFVNHKVKHAFIRPLFEQCAKSLVQLNVTFHKETLDLVERMVWDSNGDPIVYPRLETLTIDFPESTYDPYDTYDIENGERERPTVSDGILFPKVKNLTIYGDYFFEDDVVFRGNRDTLEQVHLTVNEWLMEYLFQQFMEEDQHLFANKHVTVIIPDPNSSQWASRIRAYWTIHFSQLALCFKWIASAAKTMTIKYRSFTGWLTTDSLDQYDFQGLTILNFVEEFNLRELLNLIRKLPFLVVIETKFTTCGDEFRNANVDDVVGYVVGSYGQISDTLQFWNVNPNEEYRYVIDELP